MFRLFNTTHLYTIIKRKAIQVEDIAYKSYRKKHPINASAAQNIGEKLFYLFPIPSPFPCLIKGPSCYSFVVYLPSFILRQTPEKTYTAFAPRRCGLQDFTSHVQLPASLRWHLATSHSCHLTLKNVECPGRRTSPRTAQPPPVPAAPAREGDVSHSIGC